MNLKLALACLILTGCNSVSPLKYGDRVTVTDGGIHDGGPGTVVQGERTFLRCSLFFPTWRYLVNLDSRVKAGVLFTTEFFCEDELKREDKP